MSIPKYKIEVKEPNTIGKTIAYVAVILGPITVSCKLDRVGGKFYLNPPSSFVETLQGRPKAGGGTHSGWISTVRFTPDFMDDVKKKALTELNLKEEVA